MKSVSPLEDYEMVGTVNIYFQSISLIDTHSNSWSCWHINKDTYLTHPLCKEIWMDGCSGWNWVPH